MTTATHPQTSRYYTEAELVSRGIPAKKLRQWAHKGCRFLSPKPNLPADKLKRLTRRRDEDGQWLYLRAELDKLLGLPGPSDDFTDAAGRWVNTREAARILRCTKATLSKWNDEEGAGCPWLGGDRPTTRRRRVFDPTNRRVFWSQTIWLVRDLEAIQAAQAARQRPTEWEGLRVKQAARELGVSQAYAVAFTKRGLACLDGEPIRSRKVPVLRGGRTFYRLWLCKEDVLRVKADRNRVRRDNERRHARLPKGDLTAREAAAFVGVTPAMIYIWHKQGCPYLPDCARLEQAEQGRRIRPGRTVDLYRRGQLETIKSSFAAGHVADAVQLDGELYRTAPAAEREYPHVKAFTLLHWHRKAACPHLPGGRAINTRPYPNAGHATPGEGTARPNYRRLFLDDDLRRIEAKLAKAEADDKGHLDALWEMLKDGPLPATAVLEMMEKRGAGQKRVQQLCRTLGVVVTRDGVRKVWFYALPGAEKVLTLPGVRRVTFTEKVETVECHAADQVNVGKPAQGAGTAADPPPPPPPPDLKPTWGCGTLAFGPHSKRYERQPAPNQRVILDAFQAAGWPPQVQVPSLGKQQLREAVKQLSRTVRGWGIRFAADGTGKGVAWEKTDQATP